jgi:small subunit ribosomal protein S1
VVTTDIESQETAPETVERNEFAEMLDDYMYTSPYRGQILEGIVLEATHDEILLDVGLKRDAIVTRKDLNLLDDSLRDKIAVGQEILAYVLQPSNADGELIVSINKALELEDWRSAEKIMDAGETVEARVIQDNRGGLLVSYGRLTGFVPQSHIISLPRFTSSDELEEAKRGLVGDSLLLKFIEIDRKRNRLILSERDARAQAQQSRISELEVGMKVTGRVVSIVKFGAFVDIGGVDGLIHISKLDHRHINHPGEVVAVGDEVEVIIDSIEEDQQRISLNRVALLPNPWDEVMSEYNIGDLIQGMVSNVVDFGAFIQLPNGLQGLVHVSKMSSFGTSNPRNIVREGDVALVRIISIEPQEQRIGLSMDDVTIDEQEEWMHARRDENTETTDAPYVVEVGEDDANEFDGVDAVENAAEDVVEATEDIDDSVEEVVDVIEDEAEAVEEAVIDEDVVEVIEDVDDSVEEAAEVVDAIEDDETDETSETDDEEKAVTAAQ